MSKDKSLSHVDAHKAKTDFQNLQNEVIKYIQAYGQIIHTPNELDKIEAPEKLKNKIAKRITEYFEKTQIPCKMQYDNAKGFYIGSGVPADKSIFTTPLPTTNLPQAAVESEVQMQIKAGEEALGVWLKNMDKQIDDMLMVDNENRNFNAKIMEKQIKFRKNFASGVGVLLSTIVNICAFVLTMFVPVAAPVSGLVAPRISTAIYEVCTKEDSSVGKLGDAIFNKFFADKEKVIDPKEMETFAMRLEGIEQIVQDIAIQQPSIGVS